MRLIEHWPRVSESVSLAFFIQRINLKGIYKDEVLKKHICDTNNLSAVKIYI